MDKINVIHFKRLNGGVHCRPKAREESPVLPLVERGPSAPRGRCFALRKNHQSSSLRSFKSERRSHRTEFLTRNFIPAGAQDLDGVRSGFGAVLGFRVGSPPPMQIVIAVLIPLFLRTRVPLLDRDVSQVAKRIIQTTVLTCPMKLGGQSVVLGSVRFIRRGQNQWDGRVFLPCLFLRLEEQMELMPVLRTGSSNRFQIGEKLFNLRIRCAHIRWGLRHWSRRSRPCSRRAWRGAHRRCRRCI